jgi:hypothetical protein
MPQTSSTISRAHSQPRHLSRPTEHTTVALLIAGALSCGGTIASSELRDAGAAAIDDADTLKGLDVFAGDAHPSYLEMCVALCELPNEYPATCPNNPYCTAANCPNASEFPPECLPAYASFVRCVAGSLEMAGGCSEEAMGTNSARCAPELSNSNQCQITDASEP